MTSNVPEPTRAEMLKLAQQALERMDARNKLLASMTPEERERHIHAWAEQLAESSVVLGERGVGCACCDPDVQERLRKSKEGGSAK